MIMMLDEEAARNLGRARAFLAAIEAGATGDELAAFLHPDIVQHEYPNLFLPSGATRDLAAILASAARGRSVMAKQSYAITNALAAGDQVALESLWEGTLAVPLGSLQAGAVLRGHYAAFMRFANGRIVQHRSYDCFDPW
jgi:ketosteroid isomerase-like protein